MLQKLKGVEKVVMRMLQDAQDMELSLSEQDSDYGIEYISQKLAMCSVFTERLASLDIKLVRIQLYVTTSFNKKKWYVTCRESELKSLKEYQDLSRDTKTPWIFSKMRSDMDELEAWKHTSLVVSTVRDVILSRIQVLKRLDSDIRLHQKLLDIKVAAGLVVPKTFTGSKGTAVGELDI